MKIILLFFFVVCSISKGLAVGENCASPIVVNVCPTQTFHLSTAGMGNDKNIWNVSGINYTRSGNDIVFEVNTATTEQILFYITNLSASANFYFTNGICSPSSPLSSRNLFAGSNTFSVTVNSAGTFYFWIDHSNASDITFDISIGSTSTPVFTSVPDTRGNFALSNNCITPITKAPLEITWNGVHQNLPITFAPLNTPGVVCSKLFIQNTTGQEALKQVQFVFDPDYVNISPVNNTISGSYSNGIWNYTRSGSMFTWSYTNTDIRGKGDKTGTSAYTCQGYEFCFNVTPVSNNPDRTNVFIYYYGDGFAPGFSGNIYPNSCCPNSSVCPRMSAYGGGTAAAGGIAFNDPPLPVELVSFRVTTDPVSDIVEWTTACENNCNYFELEHSANNKDYSVVHKSDAHGRASSYSVKVSASPFHKMYYRLKMVDKDGSIMYSDVIYSQPAENSEVTIYPLPAEKDLYLQSIKEIYLIEIIDLTGKQIAQTVPVKTINNEYKIDVSSLPSGKMLVRIDLGDEIITKYMVKK